MDEEQKTDAQASQEPVTAPEVAPEVAPVEPVEPTEENQAE